MFSRSDRDSHAHIYAVGVQSWLGDGWVGRDDAISDVGGQRFFLSDSIFETQFQLKLESKTQV